MNQERFVFRKPTFDEVDNIVEIINCAIKRLGDAGISQWQNGYPNKEVVLQDIANGVGRVLCKEEKILAYGALVYTGEKAYNDLEGGEWILQTQNYATIHRACVSDSCVGEGYGKLFMIFAENEAKQKADSIRIDTHPDNKIMQGLVASLHYKYCGKVMYESVRLAYEKVLK
ncbi:MAG: GNAT family N-acetyltransferase [Bacteroidales bacterium]|nr:GNAT family N-acetyltransferase [Bacteroidales bacterium]